MAINVTDEVSSTSGGSQTTAQVFTLPTTVNDGETLLAFSGFNAAIGTLTGPGGIWTSTKFTNVAGSDMVVHTAVADSGSLGGTTVAFTIGTARFGAHHAWSIADAGTVSLSGTATATDRNPDCPNETPSGGAITRMWFPLSAFADTSAAISVVPTGYANSGITSQNNANAIFCRKVSSNASENPSAYTVTGSFTNVEWIAATVAVEEDVQAVTASGTPSIPAIEADGDATVITPETASGTPSIPVITASGVAKVVIQASGTPSIPAIEASGTVTVISPALITASGAASIPSLTAAGNASIVSVEPFQPGRLHIAPFFN